MKQISLFAPLIALLSSLALLATALIWAIDSWETMQSQIEELLLMRSQYLQVQKQAFFPSEARQRARKAQKDYLHHQLESQRLLQDEVDKLEELAQDPLFQGLGAVDKQRSRLSKNPTTLHFTARPAVTGTAFRDRIFSLTSPLEINVRDLGKILELIEGGEAAEIVVGRPLLFLTDLRLERKGQEGRWTLDLTLLEREWRAAAAASPARSSPSPSEASSS